MKVFDINSPEEELFDPLFKEKNLRVFIKRDDMIHPFISGNKWRKLKYNLIDAKAANKNHIVTFGGVWSNHLLATACAAARFGFKSTAFVRGEDIPSDSLLFCRLFGMKLIFVDRTTYRNKPALYAAHFSDDPDTIFIDEGGAGENAIKGCTEIITELKNRFDHIFCAAGTGATSAGLIKGIGLNHLDMTCHVIPVLKGADFLKDNIKQYFDVEPDYKFHDTYHFGGYAKTTPPLFEFINQFSASTGILLDPIYTGKMMYAVYDLINKDYFDRGTSILALHTGGLFGLLGMKAQISASLLEMN